MDKNYNLHLTEAGKGIAEKIYERHRFFTAHLIKMGVEPKQAEMDACRIEHVISEESFKRLQEAAKKQQQEAIPSEK